MVTGLVVILVYQRVWLEKDLDAITLAQANLLIIDTVQENI